MAQPSGFVSVRRFWSRRAPHPSEISMRIGVYGGSFDPPHVGHALVAGWLKWTDQVDEVWLLPAFAHAFDKAMQPFSRRVAWCEAFARSVGPWVRVETIEASLPTPSFTVDTLQELAVRHPDHRLRLVVGADNYAVHEKWKDWEVIETSFAPIVVGRQGYPTLPGTIDFPGVSSTEIRARLRAGESVDHLVPALVRDLLGDAYSAGPRPTTP